MSRRSFSGYGRIIAAVLVGVVVSGTTAYISASQQINSLEKSILEMRNDISKMTGAKPATPTTPSAQLPPVKFSLGTALTGSGFRWLGKEGGQGENPTLTVKAGQSVTIEVVNEDGVEHDFTIPDLGVKGKPVAVKGERSSLTFVATNPGTFEYLCSIPGHKETGMRGKIVVEAADTSSGTQKPSTPTLPPTTAGPVTLEPAKPTAVSDISRQPIGFQPPIRRSGPVTVEFLLETRELVAELAPGITYAFWSYNRTVPGPLIRVREGDAVTVRIKNSDKQPHSIDLHAVTGPGGGAVATQTQPGGETSFKFKALNPGLYLYHCASPHIPTHISNGLYGLILVEPKEGLTSVDREFYVLQSEFYTSGKRGQTGHHVFDSNKAWAEQPEYVVFNGKVGSLTGSNVMKAKVGETVRIYFGNAGPNLASAFHVIGEIFDKVYPEGGLGPNSQPQVNAETILVPPGSATIVEFKVDVPGNYILLDHSIFRAIDKGAVGILQVEGPSNPEVFQQSNPSSQTSGH